MAEIQDLYDIDRHPTGETFVRGEAIPAGRYRLGVQVWLRNDNGRILLTQRHPGKKCPLMWEPTGGAVISGEDTRTAAIRELREEIGVCLPKTALRLIRTTLQNGNEYLDTYLTVWNGTVEELVLQADEVIDARWVDKNELIAMDRQGLLVCDYQYLFNAEQEGDAHATE